jgi:putative oxidoreductase
MKFGIALLRSVVGLLFVGHGLQKLAGWFGGHGLEGTSQAFEGLGLTPGRRHAIAAGVSEAAGGALLAAGLATPVGATLISGTMITAIRKVHARNGPWVTNGGYEYNLTLLAVVFAVVDVGPGEWSVDERLGVSRYGPLWALAQLGAGLVGSVAATTIGTQGAPAPATAEADRAAASGPESDAAPEAPVPASPAVPASAVQPLSTD